MNLLTVFNNVLAKGEHYAGVMLGDDGKPSHHLILLPGDAESLSFEKAQEWAEKQSGELPTRREQSLLFANLKAQFEDAYYWSCEVCESNSSCAWIQYVTNGGQYDYRKHGEFRARAVRRVQITSEQAPSAEPMTPAQIRHGFLLFAALYVSEQWHHYWRMGHSRGLYAKTRSLVLYDRTINQDFKPL